MSIFYRVSTVLSLIHLLVKLKFIKHVRLWDNCISTSPFNRWAKWGMFDLPKHTELVMAKPR